MTTTCPRNSRPFAPAFKEDGYLDNSSGRFAAARAPGVKAAPTPGFSRGRGGSSMETRVLGSKGPMQRNQSTTPTKAPRHTRLPSHRGAQFHARGDGSGGPALRKPSRLAGRAPTACRSKRFQDIIISKAFGHCCSPTAVRQAPRGHDGDQYHRRSDRPLLQPLRLADPRVRDVLPNSASLGARPTSCAVSGGRLPCWFPSAGAVDGRRRPDRRSSRSEIKERSSPARRFGHDPLGRDRASAFITSLGIVGLTVFRGRAHPADRHAPRLRAQRGHPALLPPRTGSSRRSAGLGIVPPSA
jgi:hypothetical protein